MKKFKILSILCLISAISVIIIYNFIVDSSKERRPEYTTDRSFKLDLETEEWPSEENIERTCNIPKLELRNTEFLDDISSSRASGLGRIQSCAKKSLIQFIINIQSKKLLLLRPYRLNGHWNCYYCPFHRKVTEMKISVSRKDCGPISEPITHIPPLYEFIAVECYEADGHAFKSIYTEVFALVRLKDQVEKRLEKFKQSEKVNVVILGLDSTSHMNFLRFMPSSHDFLKKELSAIGLLGYNKIADNTFPNLIPVLTGLNINELKRCWPSQKSYFDSCEFIWNNFSRKGYRTSFAEDSTNGGIFEYKLKGFKYQPTDYDLSTLIFALSGLRNDNLCLGSRLGFDVLLDNLLKSAVTFNLKRYFQFTWATNLFHDYPEYAHYADKPLFNALKTLKAINFFNDSVFVLLSDHGMRWGPNRMTEQGVLEDRLPLFYIVFPKWFRSLYPSAVRNFKLNSNALTTPFDVHETLNDLLHLEQIKDITLQERMTKEYSSQRGISLFLPIPYNRTCDMAAIDEHWCTCKQTKTISTTNHDTESASKFVVAELNKKLLAFPMCATLSLSRILQAKVILPFLARIKGVGVNNSEVSYEITFETLPNHAIFEATVLKTNIGSSWKSIKEVSRINAYRLESECISDFEVMKYCICKM